jgi:tetratricopeptide (TPR) repeat protein
MSLFDEFLFDEHRFLSALTLLSAILITPCAFAAQAPVQPSRPQTPSATQPEFQPTAEEIGDALSAHHKYQAAIDAYSNAPTTPALLNKMGIANQMMFNLREATRYYNASLKLEPRNSEVLNNLATVYDSLKEYGVAEHVYRKALKIDPHSAMILRNLGSDLLAQHKYKKGWAAYQAALSIDPQIFEPRSGSSVQNPASAQDRGAMHYYMARGCTSAGQTDCAIQYLRLSLNEGYMNPRKIAADSSFASLRQLPAFKQLIAAQSAPR